MTIEEVQALSDDELLVKVAKLCGWEEIRIDAEFNTYGDYWEEMVAPAGVRPNGYGDFCPPSCERVSMSEKWREEDDDDKDITRVPLPDYPQDLNAMREAEKVLYKEECSWIEKSNRYVEELCRICGDIDREPWELSIRATARQRAEAFVLTMEDDQ